MRGRGSSGPAEEPRWVVGQPASQQPWPPRHSLADGALGGSWLRRQQEEEEAANGGSTDNNQSEQQQQQEEAPPAAGRQR